MSAQKRTAYQNERENGFEPKSTKNDFSRHSFTNFHRFPRKISFGDISATKISLGLIRRAFESLDSKLANARASKLTSHFLAHLGPPRRPQGRPPKKHNQGHIKCPGDFLEIFLPISFRNISETKILVTLDARALASLDSKLANARASKLTSHFLAHLGPPRRPQGRPQKSTIRAISGAQAIFWKFFFRFLSEIFPQPRYTWG